MKKIMIHMIRFYQKYLSPLKVRTHCIYTPTCSQYAIEALEKYGALKGSLLAIWRILRCNPFSKGGYDCSVGSLRRKTSGFFIINTK
mgnify:CR=1 FL=1